MLTLVANSAPGSEGKASRDPEGDLQVFVQVPPAGTNADGDRVFSKIKAGLVEPPRLASCR
jgi:hypothetical protein